MKLTIWPIIAGLLTAFVVMMVFEFVNSFFFPLPEGMALTDVKSFTETLPWTAYILVLGGWIVGSFLAGYITTRLSRGRSYHLVLSVGIVLTLLGVINNMMIGHDMVFNVLGLPMFIIFTHLGYRYWLLKNQRSTDINPS